MTLKNGKKITVGLIDDNADDCKFYWKLLTGYTQENGKERQKRVLRSGESTPNENANSLIGDVIVYYGAGEALETLSSKIDVLVIDYRLGNGVKGTDVIRQIFKQPKYAHIKVVVLTGSDYEAEEVLDALEAGATAFLRKHDDRFKLEQVIIDAYFGVWSTYTSVITELIDYSKAARRNQLTAQRTLLPDTTVEFSREEKAVLLKVAEGKSSELIAEQLSISHSRVKDVILPAVYEKLGLKDVPPQNKRMTAVTKAKQLGLI